MIIIKMAYRNLRKYKRMFLLCSVVIVLLCLYSNQIEENKLQTQHINTSLLSANPNLQRICRTIFARNIVEPEYLKYLVENFTRPFRTDEPYIRGLQTCEEYLQNAGFIDFAISNMELEFPLAFSILSYRDSHQVIRLLRQIYRPQNIYCIHVDKKAPFEMFNSLVLVSDCLENVFVLPTRIDVQWGFYSVLEPDILCMRELWKRSKTWKYFINLTGQEVPLKTNYELVQILTAYNGSNDIQGTIKRANIERYRGEQAPHGLRLVKGAVHIFASRGFVDYLMTSKIAEDFLLWNKNKYHPDEIYFATLNHNPVLDIPGTYKGDPDEKSCNYRYKVWSGAAECSGKFRRAVCVFGIGDLPRLIQAPQPFANKFRYDYQPLAFDCMENWYFNKVRLEILGRSTFDNSKYKLFRFVQNKI